MIVLDGIPVAVLASLKVKKICFSFPSSWIEIVIFFRKIKKIVF